MVETHESGGRTYNVTAQDDEETEYPPTAKEIAQQKASALNTKIRNASFGRFSNNPAAAGFVYAPGQFDQKTGEFTGNRAQAADRSGMQPASAIAAAQRGSDAARAREAEAAREEAGRGIYTSIAARKIGEAAQAEAQKKADVIAAAEEVKRRGGTQKELDLQAYTKLGGSRGAYARYVSGQLSVEKLYESLTEEAESRLRYGGISSDPNRREDQERLRKMVNDEIKRLQVGPYFKDYTAFTTRELPPEAVPVADVIQPGPDGSKTPETGVDKTGGDMTQGVPGTIIEQMFPGRDLSQKPLTAQESSALAKARREGRAPSMNVDDGFEGVGIKGGYVPGYGVNIQGDITDQAAASAATQAVIKRDRDAQLAKKETFYQAQPETKDDFDPSGTMDRFDAQQDTLQAAGATYGDTTYNYYGVAQDLGRGETYGGGKSEPPSDVDERGFAGVRGVYSILNGKPNPAFYGEAAAGAGSYRRGSVFGQYELDAFIAAGGSKKDYDTYWRAQRDPDELRKKLQGQSYIPSAEGREWEEKQAELKASNLADMQAGIPATQRAGSPYELTANKYREGYFGDPGSRESFQKLYDEFLTQRRAVLVGVLSSGQPEKINLDDQKYATEKTRLMNEVMELAQGVRDQWQSQTAVSEAQGAKAVPPLEFDIPFTMERGVSPETGAMRISQVGAGYVGLGFNAETIRQNLNKLPPGDDRRAALTDVLMLYEGFEARVAEAKTAADAQVQLETFRQGFESTERQLRDTLSREDRAQDQQIQREIDTWQRNQADYLQKFQLNLQEAQMSGRWEGGTQTLERTRLEHQQAMEKEALAQTGQQRGFEQEMRTGQQALQMGQLGIEQTRAEQSATIAAAEAKRDEWQIGREKRDWEGEQTRLNAVLTGYLETPANQTLAAQEFGWAKILDEADRTGLFGQNKIETMAFKSQKFQEGLAKTKAENAARLEEIKLEMNENDNETKIAIADKQVAIEQGKLDDAVKSRRVQMKLEGDKLDFQKTQMRLEAIQSLANPKTLLVFQRTGMIPMLERILGISLNMPTFPELLPPGQTIPTQQYLNMASPGDRELIMTEASLRSGFSEMDVRSVLQRQMPGGLGVAIGYRGEGR